MYEARFEIYWRILAVETLFETSETARLKRKTKAANGLKPLMLSWVVWMSCIYMGHKYPLVCFNAESPNGMHEINVLGQIWAVLSKLSKVPIHVSPSPL